MGLIYLVVQKPFAVAVVELHEQVLVRFCREAIGGLDGGVIVEKTFGAARQAYGHGKLAVGRLPLPSYLVNTLVFQNILIVYPVDNRNPELGPDNEIGVNHDIAPESQFVPRAGLIAVAAVAFMFEYKRQLPDEAALDEQRIPDWS